MKTSDKTDIIAPCLLEAQRAMPALKRTGENTHFKSTYVTLDTLLATVRPVLSKHGIILLQSTEDADDAGMTVTTRLLHASGQWVESGIRLPLAAPSPQAAGSASSYGRRYSLEAILGLTGTEDDDGNTAEVHQVNVPAKAARPTPTPPTARQAGRPSSGAVMPFGRTKGTPLADLRDDEIQSALAWATEKGKFTEFQADAMAEMARRAGPPVPVGPAFDDVPEGLQDDDDRSLPF